MTQRKDRISTRSRTHDQISSEIRESLPVLAPGWTSHGLDEPGIAITDILAGVSDGLHFNLDRQSREAFLSTAILPESVHDLAHMLHYRPKRWVSATGNVVLSVSGEGTPETGTTTVTTHTLPAFSSLTSRAGYTILTLDALNVESTFVGQITIPAIEGVYRTFTATYSPENAEGIVLPPQNIAEQLFEVYVGGELWYEATDHPLDSALDRFYYLRRNIENRYELSFRASRGRVPTYGTVIEVRYLETIATNFDAAFLQDTNLPVVEDGTWTHTEFTNAAPPETLQQIADRAPAINTTSNRAVTLEDYRELAKQIPNVKAIYVTKSKLGWNTAEIYVATISGDVPSVELLSLVREFFSARNNLITAVRTLPANYRRFNIEMTIKPFSSFSAARVLADVRAAISDAYSYSNLTFATPIRISDIYGLVERVPGVDYVNLNALHWLSNPRETRNLVPLTNEHPLLDVARNLTVNLE